MSRAIKCDRCGKYFDEYTSKRYIGGICVRGFKVFTGGTNYEQYDLCENCVEDLYTFMNLDKKEEKT